MAINCITEYSIKISRGHAIDVCNMQPSPLERDREKRQRHAEHRFFGSPDETSRNVENTVFASLSVKVSYASAYSRLIEKPFSRIVP